MWSGGTNYSGYQGGAGASMVSKTAPDTFTTGLTYTVTVGAFGGSTSYTRAGATGLSVNPNFGNSTIVTNNGTISTTGAGSSGAIGAGAYSYVYMTGPAGDTYYGNYDASIGYGGGAGLGGGGVSGGINFPYSVIGGTGGNNTSPKHPSTNAGITIPGAPTTIGKGGNSGVSSGYWWYYDWDFGEIPYIPTLTTTAGSASTANFGQGGHASNSVAGSGGGFVLWYPDTTAALTSTTGNVTYTVSGGYRYYYWTTSGSFTV
jgi:hypothetical protein